MRILLDEMLPIGLRELLPEQDVVTAQFAGLAGLPNGELLRQAIALGFDLLLTQDRGIPQQQNLAGLDIAVVVITDNDPDLVRAYADELNLAIAGARPGLPVRVERRHER
ncbi:MAG: hypothetical protein WD830_12295 [Chloroflexota bacterium]